MRFRIKHLLIATAIVASICVAVAQFGSLYELHGEIGSVALPIKLAAFIVFMSLQAAIRRIRSFAIIALVVGCIVFSFRQVTLSRRRESLEREIPKIAEHLDQYMSAHGRYPLSLETYRYSDPTLIPYIKYESSGYGSFSISYHPCKDGWICYCDQLQIFSRYDSGGKRYFYDD